MSKAVKEKKGKTVPVWMGVLAFLLAFGAGAASKTAVKPAWSKAYSVQWSGELGTLKADLPYGEGEANKFDLYLPAGGKDSYGLAIYLHAGGFTAGDKSDDRDMLAWLCSKGYVAAGINYTLRTEAHPEASVLAQSNEIKAAVPQVAAAAEEAGYPIDRITVAGGSAGHTLAMIYAYRDGAEAPAPVAFTFGAVGPSSFCQEDWGVFGLDQSDEACAALFSVMAGTEITPEEVADGSYLEKVKPIAAAQWVKENPVPTVAAYGTHDRVQPFLASLRLKAALEENHVDHKYFTFPHSGHALQNDDALSRQWMEAIEEYLDRYMPAE